MIQRRATMALAAAAALLIQAPLWAQDAAWPSKPLKIVVPFAAGGSADLLARLMAEELRAQLKQTVVVDNRPGAGGNIAGEAVARAPADGYTLLLAAAGPVAINPSLYPRMSFRPQVDLAPVTLIAREHNLMAVPASLPVGNWREFLAYAKARPESLAFASPGNGTTAHLAGELLNQKAGLSLVHVAYKGTGPAVNDLMAGQVALMIDNMPALLPQVRAGRLKALGVASERRASGATDIPTLEEAGLPGFRSSAWKGLMAPAGTPPAVIRRVQEAIAQSLTRPDLRQRLQELGAEPVGSSPEAFASVIAEDTRQWAALVKSTGARID